MELVLYQTKDDDNVINKEMNEMMRETILFKNNVDIITPVIDLYVEDWNVLNQCNYGYIDELGRYYFIRRIENISTNRFNIYLTCDVLETYKDDILTSKGYINRQIREGDYMENSFNIDSRKTIDMYESDITLEKDNPIVLSTVRGV